MDSFHGCYEDATHDYRHFATLYLAVQFFNLLLSSVFIFHLYIPAAALYFVLAFVAKFQPYKCKRNNTIDIILLLAVINVHKLCPHLCSYYAGGLIHPK